MLIEENDRIWAQELGLWVQERWTSPRQAPAACCEIQKGMAADTLQELPDQSHLLLQSPAPGAGGEDGQGMRKGEDSLGGNYLFFPLLKGNREKAISWSGNS